jgi:hypothetical protein
MVKIEVNNGIPILGRKSILKIRLLKDVQYWNKRKTGVHKRKAGGKVYENLKIVLDSNYKEFIGKYYAAFKGKGKWKLTKDRIQTGDVVVLFFADEWNMGEKPIKYGP